MTRISERGSARITADQNTGFNPGFIRGYPRSEIRVIRVPSL
jgi:hypothetical protein